MNIRHLPITIVVADDDADDRMLIKDAFEESELRNPLSFVTNGEELMKYLRREERFAELKNDPLPGLILLDLNMPRMDGREALQAIKSDPMLHNVPVVVFTTSQSEEDVLRAYDLGVSSFISKPVTFDRLVEVVSVLGRYWTDVVQLPSRRVA